MTKRTLPFVLLLGFLAFNGCYPEKEQSPTSGLLHIRIAESIAPPVIRQVEAFLEIYGDRGAEIHYEIVSSADAVHAFVRDSIHLSVAVDSLTETETDIVDAMDGSFLVRIAAYDGIAVVTHPDNPVDVIKTTEIERMLRGSDLRWNTIDGSSRKGQIQVVLQGESDISRYLERTVMRGKNTAAGYKNVASSKEVLQAVWNDRDAVGFVGIAWIDSADVTLHRPKIFMDHPEDVAWYAVADEAREFAYGPHPANILRGYYPLSRKVYLLSRAPLGGNLATGFAAYVLNSAGQRIFFDAGIIPATQTIRIN